MSVTTRSCFRRSISVNVEKSELGSYLSDAAGGGSASALARRMIDLQEAAPQGLSIEDRRTLGWALKELGYAAWSSEPLRVSKAAEAIRSLCVPGAGPDAHEVEALAEWTEGVACLTRGEMTRAVQRLDEAAATFSTLGQPGHAAEAQVPKIMALSMLGQHLQAADCAEKTQRELIANGEILAASKVSLNLGNLHMRRDAYAQAVRHYREAGVLFARAGDQEHSVMADIGLADALTSMGDMQEALLIYARARMRAETHGFPVLAAMVAESVALLDLVRGHYRNALAGLEKSRSSYEQLGMPQPLAIAEKQLGDAYLELRLLPEALALFDQALGKFQTLDMPDEQAWTLTQRGRAQALLGQSGRAGASFVVAADLFKSQGNKSGESAVALARADLALAQDGVNAALELSQSAKRGFAAIGLTESCARADIVHAHALLRSGHVAEAKRLFQLTLDRARELELLPVQARCMDGLGQVAKQSGDRSAARAAFQLAVGLFEEQRQVLPGDEIRRAFLINYLQPYQELLRMALQDHAKNATLANAADVMAQLDRFRARALDERLTHGADRQECDAGIEAMRARLNWLYRRVERLQDEGDPTEVPAAELHETERKLLERVRRQRLAVPDGAIAKPFGDDFTIDALQSQLQEQDAIVEYGVIDDELFACVLCRGGVSVRRHLARWPDVLEAVQSALFQILTLRHGAAPVARHLESLTERAKARMARLHALVWAPLTEPLSPYRRVLVIPHGRLGSIPFGALHDGAQYLAQRHELAVAPSARVALRVLVRQPGPARRALVIGDSTRLPNAAHEARFVASLFPQASVFVGGQASVKNLRAHVGDADVIHLACHAQFRSDSPMFSALHFNDGVLTVEAAEALSLKPAIVVLSACESGLADEGAGDEMFGLVRAFLVAGAARVVASSWPVEDKIAASFMSHFYEALGRGNGPAASLQLAQGQLMKEHPHPFHWAAFSLYGAW